MKIFLIFGIFASTILNQNKLIGTWSNCKTEINGNVVWTNVCKKFKIDENVIEIKFPGSKVEKYNYKILNNILEINDKVNKKNLLDKNNYRIEYNNDELILINDSENLKIYLNK